MYFLGFHLLMTYIQLHSHIRFKAVVGRMKLEIAIISVAGRHTVLATETSRRSWWMTHMLCGLAMRQSRS